MLNPQTYTIGVHALWTNSSSNILWHLRPVDRTSQWLHWLQACEHKGTHPIALMLPVVNEATSHEDEGEFDTVQNL
jgi:hypothetical protein